MNITGWIKNMGVNKVIKEFESPLQPESIADSIEDTFSSPLDKGPENTIMFNEYPTKNLHPSDYLSSIASHIPEEIISSKNFSEIKNLAQHLTGNLTSFFGFESKLTSTNARSDYMFAISSKNDERKTLLNLFKTRSLPKSFLASPEWNRVGKFVEAWADIKSEINKNALSLWFEFDTAEEVNKIPIPSIFIHTAPLRIDSPETKKDCLWITREAIPILTGLEAPEKVEKCLIKCLEKLPKGARLLDVGIMLSRPTAEMRLVMNRMKPKDIIPYLKSIGWRGNIEELQELISELKKYVNRIVLQIGIGEKVDSKVGIECRFFPDQYNLEKGWSQFLDYLHEKGMCSAEKRNAFLKFPGEELNEDLEEFNLQNYVPTVKLDKNSSANALVRYISHIKINYKPNCPLDAKGYLGIRLFSHESNNITKMIK